MSTSKIRKDTHMKAIVFTEYGFPAPPAQAAFVVQDYPFQVVGLS